MLILVASIYFSELPCPCKRTLDRYLWLLMCDLGIVCLGVGSHRKWPPSVSVDNTDKGRTDILGQVEAKLCHWGLSSGQQISNCRAPNALTAAPLVVLHGDRVNSSVAACPCTEAEHRLMQCRVTHSLSDTRWLWASLCLSLIVSSGVFIIVKKPVGIVSMKRSLIIKGCSWLTEGVPPVQVVPTHVLHTNRGESALTHEWSSAEASGDNYCAKCYEVTGLTPSSFTHIVTDSTSNTASSGDNDTCLLHMCLCVLDGTLLHHKVIWGLRQSSCYNKCAHASQGVIRRRVQNLF